METSLTVGGEFVVSMRKRLEVRRGAPRLPHHPLSACTPTLQEVWTQTEWRVRNLIQRRSLCLCTLLRLVTGGDSVNGSRYSRGPTMSKAAGNLRGAICRYNEDLYDRDRLAVERCLRALLFGNIKFSINSVYSEQRHVGVKERKRLYNGRSQKECPESRVRCSVLVRRMPNSCNSTCRLQSMIHWAFKQQVTACISGGIDSGWINSYSVQATKSRSVNFLIGFPMSSLLYVTDFQYLDFLFSIEKIQSPFGA